MSSQAHGSNPFFMESTLTIATTTTKKNHNLRFILPPKPSFVGAKQLVAYAGLDPSVYESGKILRRSRISK
jgi:hypothetical protein